MIVGVGVGSVPLGVGVGVGLAVTVGVSVGVPVTVALGGGVFSVNIVVDEKPPLTDFQVKPGVFTKVGRDNFFVQPTLPLKQILTCLPPFTFMYYLSTCSPT